MKNLGLTGEFFENDYSFDGKNKTTLSYQLSIDGRINAINKKLGELQQKLEALEEKI